MYAKYRGKGLALDSETIDRKKDYYAAIESLSSANVKRVTLQGELLDLQKMLSSLDSGLNEQKQSLISDIASIDQKMIDIEKTREYLITAPFKGIVTSITVQRGQRITAGQRLAVLIPLHAVAKVELFSSSNSLGEIRQGQQVKMRVAAYPYQWYGKISGRIETLTAAPINTPSPVQHSDNKSETGLFRIRVKPEPTAQQVNLSLLPGMAVETEIYVKTRRIYQWLFTPMQTAYHRATNSAG